MKELLESKIEELKIDIKKCQENLKHSKDSSKRYGENSYYEYFAQEYTELYRLQFALDILEELQDEIEKED